MMKHKWIMFALLMIITGCLTGCSSLMDENYLTRNGGLASQPMMVITRPHEFGLEVVGDSTGTATTKKVLFFTISGDRPNVTLPIVGTQSRSPLETLACYRAAQSKGGDAFFAVSSQWEKKNIMYVYQQQTVTVTGKSMKIKDLGELSAERADKPINREKDPSGSTKSTGFFGALFGNTNP